MHPNSEPHPFVMLPAMVARYRARISALASRVWRLTAGNTGELRRDQVPDVFRLGEALDDLLDRNTPTLREHCAAARVAHEGFIRSGPHVAQFRAFEVELGSIAMDFFGRTTEDEPGPGPDPDPTPVFAGTHSRQSCESPKGCRADCLDYIARATAFLSRPLADRVDRVIDAMIDYLNASIEIERTRPEDAHRIEMAEVGRLTHALETIRRREHPAESRRGTPNPGGTSSIDNVTGRMMTDCVYEQSAEFSESYPIAITWTGPGHETRPKTLHLPAGSRVTIEIKDQ